ncbi:hypothetical protein MchiMG62_12840 [Methanoculleus chikugoensis]|uniref:Uncharacterized protein n=1 Tax=Methanoculleus chikugoensis TaxID=118126 RepID=A0ABN5XH38_9EURY|nr:hypothetical protein MchiMG62_12840 [Methanoculleus chikugoensis]
MTFKCCRSIHHPRGEIADQNIPGTIAPEEAGLEPVAGGFTSPVALASPGNGTGRLFAADLPEDGRVSRLVPPGVVPSHGRKVSAAVVVHPCCQDRRASVVGPQTATTTAATATAIAPVTTGS